MNENIVKLSFFVEVNHFVVTLVYKLKISELHIATKHVQAVIQNILVLRLSTTKIYLSKKVPTRFVRTLFTFNYVTKAANKIVESQQTLLYCPTPPRPGSLCDLVVLVVLIILRDSVVLLVQLKLVHHVLGGHANAAI